MYGLFLPYTVSFRRSGFIPHGATASSIFGASSEASERPYNLNEPTSPSLMNFLGRGRARGGSLRDLYDRTASIAMNNIMAMRIAHKEHEDERCEELWRAFRDDAGLWMAHRFDLDAWNDEEEKEEQDELPDGFNGILTKAIIAPNLSKLEASPIYHNYAYTKCVLTKKKLTNIDLLQTYQYLQYLDLSFNKLSTLKPLEMLPFLKFLEASRNSLTSILDFKPPFFLTVVNLSRNKIKKMRDLSEFWSLTDLNLSHNMIKVIEGLKDLRFLSNLNLSFNHIETLENLSGLRLQYLFLQNNMIKIDENDVKAQLATLKNIRNVNLCYNQVSSLKIFEKVENLECLDIVNNNISRLLDIYYLRNLKYLNKLNLTGNPVTTLERYVEVCVTHIRNLVLLDNRQIDTDLWLEILSNQTKDVHQMAAHNQLKLTVLEQLKPPEIWTWLCPYDEPPITVIVLVGLQASRRSYMIKKFCDSNKKVVIGIPHTTKPKPVDEDDGEYCYYIDESTFMTMLQNGEFLAYQEVLGTYLGIAHSELKKAKNAILMLSSDLVMALTIKRHFLNTIFVLALPSCREAHLKNMNILYAFQVFENGTIKILNSPGMVAQLQADFEKRRDTDNWSQAKAFLESIVKQACENGASQDVGEPSVVVPRESDESTLPSSVATSSITESRKSEKSEIVQLWISAAQPEFPLSGSLIIQPATVTKNPSYFLEQPVQPSDVSKDDDTTQTQAKRLVSFTVVHIHKVYDCDMDTGRKTSNYQTEVPKGSYDEVKGNLAEKIPSTKPSTSTKSFSFDSSSDKDANASTCTSSPLSARYVFTGNKCYAEIQSDDPKIKFLFDEEHRKREELLELHLDMPGLFRELLFTDQEEITMKKLQTLVKDISRFNETTKREVLSFEHDKNFNGVIKDKTINLFQDIENAKMTSGQQAAKYTPPVYSYRCQYGRCDNPSCIQWSDL